MLPLTKLGNKQMGNNALYIHIVRFVDHFLKITIKFNPNLSVHSSSYFHRCTLHLLHFCMLSTELFHSEVWRNFSRLTNNEHCSRNKPHLWWENKYPSPTLSSCCLLTSRNRRLFQESRSNCDEEIRRNLQLLDHGESDNPFVERNNDNFQDGCPWLQLHRAPWPLCTTSVDGMQESRCIQLLSGWTREVCWI